MSNRTLIIVVLHLSMFANGFFLNRLGFSIGEVIAFAIGLVALAVILACAFAGLFIDLDAYKDQRQQ